jgi:hypothetical protein
MGSDSESRSAKDEVSIRDIEYLRDSQYAIADNLNARVSDVCLESLPTALPLEGECRNFVR